MRNDLTWGLRERAGQHADLYRALLDAAPDATVVVDQDATIVMANARVETVFGYRRGELIGHQIETLVPPRFRPGHPRRRDSYLDSHEPGPMNLGLAYAVRKDGSEFPVEITLSPVETESGRLVSAAVRDVSERLALQDASTRMREELIATVSHELRTPLTSIIGYVEVLAEMEDEIGQDARHLLEIIQRNAARELRLVNDLLTLGFIGDRQLHVRLESIDLNQVVGAVLQDTARQARAAGIVVDWREAPVPPVIGDQQRLGQVAENLLTNALKFSPGGSVTVTLRDGGADAVLEVTDTGVGVAADELPRLFERLYRTPHAVAAQIPGAGLGLPIVRAIVDAHGGRIEIDSEVGVGSTFRVLLPYDGPCTG